LAEIVEQWRFDEAVRLVNVLSYTRHPDRHVVFAAATAIETLRSARDLMHVGATWSVAESRLAAGHEAKSFHEIRWYLTRRFAVLTDSLAGGMIASAEQACWHRLKKHEARGKHWQRVHYKLRDIAGGGRPWKFTPPAQFDATVRAWAEVARGHEHYFKIGRSSFEYIRRHEFPFLEAPE
jgi:hypothetical protein